MKKILLLIFIVLCAAFIYVKLQTLGNENSEFNQTTRYHLGRYSLLRSLFGLHSDGDGREWYLENFRPLVVEVVEAEGTSINREALDLFLKRVQDYTGRKADLYNIDRVKGGMLTDSDLEEVVRTYRRHIIPGEPNLFIIYAEDFQREGAEMAKTFKEFGMVLSNKRLEEETGGEPRSLTQYVESTLLHEFGHQLGLAHNSEENCIMNKWVETSSLAGEFSGKFTPTDFCDFELKQLETIKASIH